MPGKIGLSCPSFAIRLSRNSSFTRRERNFSSEKGLRRNSPRVREKLIAAQLQKLSAISRKQRRNVLIIRPRGSSFGQRASARQSAKNPQRRNFSLAG